MTEDMIPTSNVPIEKQLHMPSNVKNALFWIMAGAIVISAIFGLPRNAYALCPKDGATPLNIGPVNPVNGFPVYVQDSEGLALELCLNGGTDCFFDPVLAGNAFSQDIGFGAEAFWWAAQNFINIPATGFDAILVQAVEAAFISEEPAIGDQFPFTRLRIRIDVPEPGVYTVTHPYGEEVYVVETVGAGQEIRETFDIVLSADSSHQGRVGPLLRWDSTSPPPPAGFIGDASIGHAVTGSPCGTNFFRITAIDFNDNPIDLDGQGGNVIMNDQFIVLGKLHTQIVPAPLVVERTSYSRTSSGQINVFATSATTASLTVNGGATLNTGTPISMSGNGSGIFFAHIPLADASSLPETVNVIATNPGNDPRMITSTLVDQVTITRAEYSENTETLIVEAVSSDQSTNQPTLTATGIGLLVGGSISMPGVAVAPTTVIVSSSAGGVDSEPVKLLP